jgi:hypothetical protein
MSPICNQMHGPYNQLVCMVIVEVDSNKYEASTLRTVFRDYNRILQITPIYPQPAQNGNTSTNPLRTILDTLWTHPGHRPLYQASIGSRKQSSFNLLINELLIN